MNKNLYFLLLLIVSFSLSTFSQNRGDKFGDHMRYGGSVNLGFSNNFTTIGVAPSAIYDFYNGFSTGASISYYYTERKDTFFDYKSNVIGGSLITMYSPLPYMQLSAEFEQLNVNRTEGIIDIDPYWVSGLYLGIAYFTGNVSLGIRYDVLYDDGPRGSIYGSAISPVLRAYF
ncbi:MAG: hypothetical protein BM563_03880 [Bacteroidetes bacterium MedPE-SWsnd-G1]|nr:MAG: hypothetical protein BM563_03880 [Bacteroidetes bacterium MedPE-SWsnd-G1]